MSSFGPEQCRAIRYTPELLYNGGSPLAQPSLASAGSETAGAWIAKVCFDMRTLISILGNPVTYDLGAL